METKTTGHKTTKGHWPKGKRRNGDNGEWSRTLLALTAVLSEHYAYNVCTPRALATALGVDPRTVHRWIKSEDRPSPENQTLIKEWIATIKKRAKA